MDDLRDGKSQFAPRATSDLYNYNLYNYNFERSRFRSKSQICQKAIRSPRAIVRERLSDEMLENAARSRATTKIADREIEEGLREAERIGEEIARIPSRISAILFHSDSSISICMLRSGVSRICIIYAISARVAARPNLRAANDRRELSIIPFHYNFSDNWHAGIYAVFFPCPLFLSLSLSLSLLIRRSVRAATLSCTIAEARNIAEESRRCSYEL
jgi:hypothetical protein